MFLFPEVRYLNEFSRPRIRPKTPEFGSKRTPHLRSTVPNVQRHMAYFGPWSFPLGAIAQRMWKGAAGCRERNDNNTSSGVRAYLFKCSCNFTCKVPRKEHASGKGRMGPIRKSASIFIRINPQKIWRICVRTRHTRAATHDALTHAHNALVCFCRKSRGRH